MEREQIELIKFRNEIKAKGYDCNICIKGDKTAFSLISNSKVVLSVNCLGKKPLESLQMIIENFIKENALN